MVLLRLSLTRRLVAAFIAVALITALGGLCVIIALRSTSATFTRVSTKLDATAYALESIDGDLKSMKDLARDYILFKRPATVTKFNSIAGTADKTLADLPGLLVSSADQATVQGMKTQLSTFLGLIKKAFDLVDAGKVDEATAFLDKEIRPTGEALESTAAQFSQRYGDTAKEAGAAAARSAASAQVVGSLVLLLAMVLAIILGAFLARSIALPVRRVAEAAQQLAEGDLKIKTLHVKTRDEVGEMATAFNQMV